MHKHKNISYINKAIKNNYHVKDIHFIIGQNPPMPEDSPTIL